jgi:hypothetical protein
MLRVSFVVRDPERTSSVAPFWILNLRTALTRYYPKMRGLGTRPGVSQILTPARLPTSEECIAWQNHPPG